MNEKYGTQFISESDTLNISVWLGIFVGNFVNHNEHVQTSSSMGSAGDTDTDDFKKSNMSPDWVFGPVVGNFFIPVIPNLSLNAT